MVQNNSSGSRIWLISFFATTSNPDINRRYCFGVISNASWDDRGHEKAPEASRLYKRRKPSPSQSNPFMRSLRFPQKRNSVFLSVERIKMKLFLDNSRQSFDTSTEVSEAGLSWYWDKPAYAQDFFILIFMKSLLVSRETPQKDEDNIFTSIHTAGPSLLHRQAKLVFHLKKDSPFPSLLASYLLKARRKSWSFLSMNGQVFWK